jgi:hypothetical protein
LALPVDASQGPFLVARTVQSVLALEWMADRFPIDIVVVLRGAYNVLSSWERLWMRNPGGVFQDLDAETLDTLADAAGIPVPGKESSPMSQSACLYGLLVTELLSAARRHPEWHLVWHESLAAEPLSLFPNLAHSLGLPWTVDSAHALLEMDSPGTGFETRRIARETRDVWRGRLTRNDIEEIDAVLHGRFSGPVA